MECLHQSKHEAFLNTFAALRYLSTANKASTAIRIAGTAIWMGLLMRCE